MRNLRVKYSQKKKKKRKRKRKGKRKRKRKEKERKGKERKCNNKGDCFKQPTKYKTSIRKENYMDPVF